MKSFAIFITGIVLGAVSAVVGFFVADWLAAPKWSRR